MVTAVQKSSAIFSKHLTVAVEPNVFRVHHRQFFVVMRDQCRLNRSRNNCTDCYCINRSVARFCTLRLRIAFSAVTNSPYPAKLHKTSFALLRGCIFELAFPSLSLSYGKNFPKNSESQREWRHVNSLYPGNASNKVSWSSIFLSQDQKVAENRNCSYSLHSDMTCRLHYQY